MTFDYALTRRRDLTLFLLPLLVAGIIAAASLTLGQWNVPMGPEHFLLLYLLVDFPHVYSTLYRFRQFKDDPWSSPAFAATLAVFSFSALAWLFQTPTLGWSFLAYLAIIHFIRQQVGWLSLTQSNQTTFEARVEKLALYGIMVSGVVYWHTNLGDTFTWFEGAINISVPKIVSLIVDIFTLGAFIGTVYIQWCYYKKNNRLRIGKILLFLSTFVTWQVMLRWVVVTPISFAIFNTITHGLPYLIWMTWYAKHSRPASIFSRSYIAFFLPLLILAYTENTFSQWVTPSALGVLFPAGSLSIDEGWRSLLVALILTPQTTHFLLDGFIWKFSKSLDLQVLLSSLRK